LLGILFNPEDGCDIFLQNIIWFSADYIGTIFWMVWSLHNHCYENLKSCIWLFVCIQYER
jgi:hypothetical protein